MSLELGNDEGTLIYQLKAILYFGVLLLLLLLVSCPCDAQIILDYFMQDSFG